MPEFPGGRWVDLHSHVLPGIDDGPATMIDSLAMALVAAGAGTRVLAATPHVRSDHPEVRIEELAGRVADLNGRLAERNVDLSIVGGGEVALTEALERPVEELRLVTLAGNGRDLLVDTPHGPLPSSFETLVLAVAGRGFRVVLAHPEHNPDFQREPERLGALAEAGVLLQVTAGSFTASRKAAWRKLAERLLREGWAHVLASDAHSASWRPPVLGDGIQAAERAVPEAAGELEWMARDVPAAIVAGGELPERPARPSAPARARRFGLRRSA